jgi:hypothetical protein
MPAGTGGTSWLSAVRMRFARSFKVVLTLTLMTGLLSVVGAAVASTTAAAVDPGTTCTSPTGAQTTTTTTTFVDGQANNYNVTCYEQTDVSGTAAYPTIAITSGTLPTGATFAGANQTTCSSSAGGTTTTSGSGATEEYILECNIAYTPPAGYNTPAPVQFTVTPTGGYGAATVSSTLNITFASPSTPTCIDPASAGTTTTFEEGTSSFYTVECYDETGVSGIVSYPKQMSIATGSFPSTTPHLPGGTSTGTEPGTPGTGTGTSSATACGTTTSGSGATEEYILECEFQDTPNSADAAGNPNAFTFNATNVLGVTSGNGTSGQNSGNLNVNVAPGTVTCIDPASGGTTTTFYEGGTNAQDTYTVECESTSGISGVTAYPSSISINSGSLPNDAAQELAGSNQQTCSTSAGGTTTTSGSGGTEDYILECVLSAAPQTDDAGSYPFTFTATGPGGYAASAVSGTLTVNISGPSSACLDPSASGTTTTFTDGTAGSYTVECYSQGFASASPGNYPTDNIASGSLPSSGDITFGGAAQTTCSTSTGGTTTTSGSGFSEEYITECKLAGTPTVQDNGTYPLTFSTTAGANGGSQATSGTLNLKIAGVAPTIHSDQYFNAVAGVPFCFDFAMDTTDTIANGGLPLTSLTAGTTPANVSGYGLQNVNLVAGTAQICGTASSALEGVTSETLAPVATNSEGSVTGSIAFSAYAEADWVSSGENLSPGTPGATSSSLFDSNQDLWKTGNQAAFGDPITGGLQDSQNTTTGREAGTITLVPLTSGSSTVTTATSSVFTSDNGGVESNLVGDTINSTGLTVGTVITGETSSGSPVQYTLTLSQPVATTESSETVQVYYNSSVFPYCTESGVQGGTNDCMVGGGGLGYSPTVVLSSPLPTPIDPNANSTANLGSVDLDLGTDTDESYPTPPTGGCWGNAVIDLGGSNAEAVFGSTNEVVIPSPWVAGGNCAYGSLGSNSASTDSPESPNEQLCPPTQTEVNAGMVDCSATAASGNDGSGANTSFNYSSDDLFFANQPVPQTSTVSLSTSNAGPGGSVSISGGTNWWGAGNTDEPNTGCVTFAPGGAIGACAPLTLSTALTSGQPVTSLSFSTALTDTITSGDTILVTSSGHSQTFVASGTVTNGATAVSVSSQNANFNYPVGSDVEDETAGTTGGATYGSTQVGDYYPLGAPQVYIGTNSASAHAAGPVSSNVTLWASTYNCTGTSTTTNGNIAPCNLEIGGKNPNYAGDSAGTAAISGSFTVPSNLTPGTYNVYVDALNNTPLPGNGPVDASIYPASPNGQTDPSIALGTDEAVTQITVMYPSTTTSTPANSSIVLGSSNSDSATVTGSQSPDPTGSVAFYECGPTPSATPCTSATWTVFDNETLNGTSNPSTVSSVPFTPTSTGYWCFAAVYSGDSNYGGSADQTTDECFDVTKSGSTTVTAPTNSSIVLGTSNTDGATVTGAANGVNDPTGSVTFYDCASTSSPTPCTSASWTRLSTETLGGNTNPSTVTSASFTPTSTGYSCFAAVYSGDSNYTGSSDQTTDECFSVTKAGSTTVTTPTDSTIVLGNTNTDGVVVTGNTAGGAPTGSVSFYECGPDSSPTPCTSTANQVGSAVTLSAGSGDTSSALSAAFTPTSTGTWCFAAVYSGDSNYSGSSDQTTDECFTVTAAGSTTVTTPTNSSIALGNTNTDGVVVTGNAAGGAPTGSVSYYECGPDSSPTACTSTANQVGSAVTLTAGSGDTSSALSAAFTPTSTGTWCFAAVYSGDSNYSGSSDQTTDECFSVGLGASSTTTTPTSSSIVLGTTNTDGAVVTGNTAGGAPTGSVSFYECGPDSSPTACTSTANQVGSAVTLTAGSGDTSSALSAAFTPTSTGTWCFAAVYSGDSNYSGSSDQTTDECFSVAKASSDTVTTPTNSSIVLGTTNTDGVVVTGNTAGGAPTGSVSFYECGPDSSPTACTSTANQVGSAVTLTAGSGDTSSAQSAAFTPTSTGTWCFGAHYSGDSNYHGSSDKTTDECFDVTVTTSTTVTAPTSSGIVLGTSNTDGATVTGAASGTDPTGSVAFYECGPDSSPAPCTSASWTQFDTETLNGTSNPSSVTSAAFTPTSSGHWCFAAVYSGDSNYTGSSDETTDECFTVAASSSTTVTTPTHSSIVLGTTNTDGVVVTGNDAGGAPTGTVSFYECGPDSSPTACASTANQVGSAVTLTTGSGDTSSAQSAALTPTSTGTWCFGAVYSGDSNYASSADQTTDECFSVTKGSSDTVTTPTNSSITLGTTNTDGVVVTGNTAGGAPTGSVSFYECGPNSSPTDCTSTANQVGSSVTLTAGSGDTSSAQSAAFTPTSTGYWCFGAHYSGDSNYSGSSDKTTDECFDVTVGASTTVTTPTNSSIVLGTTNTDGVVVTGNTPGGAPTGSVSFYECGPDSSPTACTSTANQVGSAVTLTAGSGDTSSAQSAAFTPTSTGYWCFAAVYSGDSNYSRSSDKTTDECFTVTAAASTTATIPTHSSIVLGTTNTDGAVVTGNTAGGAPTGSVSFYECGPDSSATSCTSTANQVGSAVTLTAGSGDTSSAQSAAFTPTSTGYWCFAAVYSGGSNYTGSSDTATLECFDVTAAASTTTAFPSSSTISYGSSDTDVATVAGNTVGGAPLGSVTFYECGPTATETACTSKANSVGTVSLSAGAGDASYATSPSFTPSGGIGYYCFGAYYLGGTQYTASNDTLKTECFFATGPPPTITSFTPVKGPVGTSVTITGTNLSNATSVSFDGTAATITSNTATKIKVKVPSGAATGKIQVKTASGKVKSSTDFTVT